MVKKYFGMDKIDFILIWVDDSDPKWREKYAHYSKLEFGDSRSVRFRDWGTLKYWFRGVEKYAPWFNKLFFVTCGHYPKWLNLSHPKLQFVTHEEYIPKEYLPTFNSHTIELNLHRIKGLSDRFVYFNDDTFIINKVSPHRFFEKGVPCDIAVLNALQPISNDAMIHILCNDISIINKSYSKDIIYKNYRKWFNIKYGSNILRTIALCRYPHFTGFLDPHLPNSFVKDYFFKVWERYPTLLDKTCKCRFRAASNINQYLIRYTQLVEGFFHPINPFVTSYVYPGLKDSNLNDAICDILNQDKPLICLNDGDSNDISDFLSSKRRIIDAFESILPDKSSFEI